MTFGAGGQRSNPLSYGRLRMRLPQWQRIRRTVSNKPKRLAHMSFALRNSSLDERSIVEAVAERARFELAEEREPLAGLANRCLGPLDYLSRSPDSTASSSDNSTQIWALTVLQDTLCPSLVTWNSQLVTSSGGGGGIRTRETRGLPVFKTGGFVRSPTPPVCLRDSTRS